MNDPARLIPIEKIILDPDFQVREQLDEATVQHYQAILDRLPPVQVARVGRRLILVDGWHRMEAARRDRWLKMIAADIREMTETEAYEAAVKANAANPLQMKTKDRKRAAEGMLRRFTERSDNWIAEDCGLSDKTVRPIREKLESTSEIPRLSILKTKDGREHPREIARPAPQPEPEETPESAGPEAPAEETDSRPDFQPDPGEKATPSEADEEPLITGNVAEVPSGLEDIKPGRPVDEEPAAVGPEEDRAEAEGDETSWPATVGAVRIWCGDARTCVWALEDIHLTITSPPYNVGIGYGDEDDDDLPLPEYVAMLREVFAFTQKATVAGGRIAVVVPFGVGRNPWVPLASRVADVLVECGWTLRGQIVWDKGTSGNRTSWGSFRLPTDPSLRDTCECILIAHKEQSRMKVPEGVLRRDTEGSFSPFLEDQQTFMNLAQDHWTAAPESATRVGHPAPFPVELVERLIRFYAFPGACILDPFAGSGTVGVAAIRLGCRAELIERWKPYCMLAKERCENE